MARALFAVMLILALAGCANWNQHLQRQADSYVGRPLEAMYDEYGGPYRATPLSNGGQFVEFRTTRGGYLCTARAKTDSHGIVTSIAVGGQNGCIMGR